MASDNFSATNNPLASPWQAVTAMSAFESTGGEARATTTDCAMVYSTSSELSSQVVLSDRTGGGADDNGPGLWDPSTGNGYFAVITGSDYLIIRYAAGAYSADTSAVGTAAQGDTARIYIDGDDVVLTKNGVEVLRRTDTTYRTGLKPGLYGNNAEGALDDWTDGAASGVSVLPIFGTRSNTLLRL